MLGLTSQQVAEVLGITYQQLYKYEKGVNRISAGRLHALALARALEVDVGYFYEGLGSGEPARPTSSESAAAGVLLHGGVPGGHLLGAYLVAVHGEHLGYAHR